MQVPKRPLSMKPDAIRQRRRFEKVKLEREAAHLASQPSGLRGKPGPKQKPIETEAATVAPGSIPLHTTKTVNVGGADRFASVPAIAQSDGSASPLVPPSEAPSDPSDTSTTPDGQATAGEPSAPSGPPPGTITPEEAKLFGAALRQYFEFGCGVLLAKHPEMATGLVAISGDPDSFRRNFQIAGVLVGGCGERVALKYNLRIPYMDEAVVIGAIGLATFGLAGKPSKQGEQAIKQAQEAQRAGVARDANPKDPQPTASPGSNGKSAAPPPPPDDLTQTINPNMASGINLQ